MRRNYKILTSILIMTCLLVLLAGCGALGDEVIPTWPLDSTQAPVVPLPTPGVTPSETPSTVINESGSYTTKEDVALYIYTFGRLPDNFITKAEARELGWNGGGLEKYATGKCIGGDRFGNYEGLLPEKNGRKYFECDIDTLGASSRNAKRIVFSNDRLIFYTDDHYESFTQFYGEEGI